MQRCGKLVLTSFSTSLQTNSFKFYITYYISFYNANISIIIIVQLYNENDQHLFTQVIIKDTMSYGYNEQNLNYDDYAFLHFLNALCVLACLYLVISIVIIIRNIVREIKQIKKLEQYQYLRDKINNTLKQNNKQQTKKLVWKIVLLMVCILVSFYCVTQILDGPQFAKFDPYQILGITQDSTIQQIKKSFRKIALSYHPDKNRSKYKIQKFEMAARAYHCLTMDNPSKQKIQWCVKTGNQNGQSVFQEGIGLPSVLLKSQISGFFGVGLLVVVLLVIPMKLYRFIVKAKDKSNIISVENVDIIYQLMTQRINFMDLCIIYGCLAKQITIKNGEKSKVDTSQQNMNSFLLTLQNQSQLSRQLIHGLTPREIDKIFQIYNYIKGQQKYEPIVKKSTQICNKMVKLSLLYAKKSRQGYQLHQKKKQMIQWSGLGIFQQTLKFCQQVIQSLPLKSHQLQNKKLLPILQCHTKILLQDKQITAATRSDFLIVNTVIKNLQTTPGFVCCSKFPYLVNQQFVLIIASNGNVLSSHFFNFSNNKNEVVHNFQLKKHPVGNLDLTIKVVSLNYKNVQICQQKSIQIEKIAKVHLYQKQKKKVKIHKQDRKIQLISNNFFESLIKFDRDDQIQLSDSQQIEPKRKKQKKQPKIKKQKQNVVEQSKDK